MYLFNLIIEVLALVDQPSKVGQCLKLCSAQLSVRYDILEGRGEGFSHCLVQGGLLETVRSLVGRRGRVREGGVERARGRERGRKSESVCERERK